MRIIPIVLPIILLTLMACSKEDPMTTEGSCSPGHELVLTFVNTDNITVQIYDDGNAYFLSNSSCEFVGKYYDPDFDAKTFNRTDSGVYYILGNDSYLAPVRDTSLDFEGFENALDLFRTDIDQADLFLTNFTLQSPSARTVDEYVALQQCILKGTCDFIDNKILLVTDPTNPDNTVMEFYAIPPDAEMVTSKTSVSTTLAYFEKGDDFWFEARYFIKDNLPTTLADFESSFFLESPGPRIIIRGDKLAIENKFNEKLTFDQPASATKAFPLNQWVTVKVHLSYDAQDGMVQLWQDGELIVDQRGPTMPLDMWIQDRVEIGITATQKSCTLYLDDVRFSSNPL